MIRFFLLVLLLLSISLSVQAQAQAQKITDLLNEMSQIAFAQSRSLAEKRTALGGINTGLLSNSSSSFKIFGSKSVVESFDQPASPNIGARYEIKIPITGAASSMTDEKRAAARQSVYDKEDGIKADLLTTLQDLALKDMHTRNVARKHQRADRKVRELDAQNQKAEAAKRHHEVDYVGLETLVANKEQIYGELLTVNLTWKNSLIAASVRLGGQQWVELRQLIIQYIIIMNKTDIDLKEIQHK